MTISGVVIGAGTALVMAYSGLLFDPPLMRQQLSCRNMKSLVQLAIVSFVLIPLATLGMIRLVPTIPDLNLVLLTLSVMPCAPLVPALVSMAGEPPDWSMFVFLVFSMFGILLIPVLLVVLPLPWAAGSLAHADNVSGLRILLYLLTGYLPLLLGIALRLLDNVRGLRMLGLLKPTIPYASVIGMLAILLDHWQDVAGVTLGEIGLMAASILMYGLIGFVCGPRLRGAPMTNILPSAFRNVTMALAFSNTVFAHTKATSYIFAFTIVLLLLIFAAMALQRRMTPRPATISHEMQ